MTKKYILTLSCKDKKGIVAEVSGFLLKHDCFILESSQFGDFATEKFFMRAVFETGTNTLTYNELKDQFTIIANNFGMEWNLYDTSKKPRLLLLASKQGHCLNDILHRYQQEDLKVEIPAVVSNHPDLERMASWYDIPYHHLPVTKETKAEQEEEIWKLVQKLDIDLVVLARYMQIISPELTAKLKGKAINIHHSFLPSFKGAKPYHQAYDRGVKIIGATAHYVTEALDEGPIIDQEIIHVDHTHSPKKLVGLGQDIERRVLMNAINYHIEQRVLLNGLKTVVFK